MLFLYAALTGLLERLFCKKSYKNDCCLSKIFMEILSCSYGYAQKTVRKSTEKISGPF